MKEFKTIVNEYRKVDLSQRKAALATVVQVRGSSYRSPGARMLITDDGKWVGSISGGCLEGDALRQARQVMMNGVPQTVTYDTREESNQNLGISLGCNGVIDVLIERLDASDGLDSIRVFREVASTGSPVALATVFGGPEPQRGRKVLISGTGVVFSNVSDIQLDEMLKNDLHELFTDRVSQARLYTIGST